MKLLSFIFEYPNQTFPNQTSSTRIYYHNYMTAEDAKRCDTELIVGWQEIKDFCKDSKSHFISGVIVINLPSKFFRFILF